MEKMIKMQKVKRLKKHGFRSRQKTHGGSKVLQRRRQRGRATLTISKNV